MDAKSLQNFLNGEHDMLTTAVDLFRDLVPAPDRDASVHSGEEGRFIEMVLAEYLREKLPAGIGIGGGFIVDAHGKWVSKQIDIILYDSVRFAPVLRYGDAVIVPLESVIGAISVKRKLYNSQLPGEFASLSEIGARASGVSFPKPVLALVAFECEKSDPKSAVEAAFAAIKTSFAAKTDRRGRTHLYSWNELIDHVIVFDKFILRTNGHSHREDLEVRKKPQAKTKQLQCSYVWAGNGTTTRNVYIQHLLSGIHRAWYDEDRGNRVTRDLLAFPQSGMKKIGAVDVCVYCRPYAWANFEPAVASKPTTAKLNKRRTKAPKTGSSGEPPRDAAITPKKST
ncbi:DUF6602 domain-containing protein [Pandoraea anhela]|uniref:DUF6602 domain-containing protein n=1 Tax=Pandoraea anhela TaxID=2508295 RepID=A0A5E4Z4K2_9BURK|nr:DUF6602 domain-containing protein [Pandoraea anhela]VVE56104.1 hypothetical protein PAN31108_05065 [Pandoraea anhela]